MVGNGVVNKKTHSCLFIFELIQTSKSSVGNPREWQQIVTFFFLAKDEKVWRFCPSSNFSAIRVCPAYQRQLIQKAEVHQKREELCCISIMLIDTIAICLKIEFDKKCFKHNVLTLLICSAYTSLSGLSPLEWWSIKKILGFFRPMS